MSKEFDWSQFEEVESPDDNEILDWDQFEGVEPLSASTESNTIGSLFKGAAKGVGSVGLGATQGAGNSLISILNALSSGAPGIMGAYNENELAEMPQHNIPALNLREYAPEGAGHSVAFGGGDILGSLLGFNKANQGLKGVQKLFEPAILGRGKGIVGDILRGGTAAALTGEHGFGGRAGSAALGGAAEGLGAFSKQKALAKLLRGKEEALAPASEAYGEISRALEKAGKTGKVSETLAERMNYKELSKHLTKEELSPIKKLVEKGAYEDLNKAQSELSSLARKLKSEGKAGKNVVKALDAVKGEEKRIHGRIYEALKEVDKDLPAKYQEANQLYAKAIEPYDLKPLKKFEKLLSKYGETDSKARDKVVKELMAEENFRLGLGKKHPEIALSAIEVNPLTRLAKLLKGK